MKKTYKCINVRTQGMSQDYGECGDLMVPNNSSEKYYAHSGNQTQDWEPVGEHIKLTAHLAKEFAQEWECQIEAEAAALLHDGGKYSDLFQKVLAHQAQHIDHATPGALALIKYYRNNGLAAAMAAKAHHEGLLTGIPKNFASMVAMKERTSTSGKTFSTRDTEKIIHLLNSDGFILPENIASEYPSLYSGNQSVAAMMYVRMLLSALVDADYLATEAHFNGSGKEYALRSRGKALHAEVLLENLLKYVDQVRKESNASPTTRQIRDDLFNVCLNGATQPRNIFKITAPTGAGKTLAMLAFGLRHASHNKLRRIIVVLPYLSIVDQTIGVYKAALQGNGTHELILEDHSLIKDQEGDTTRLLAQNWDAPIIVTTTVKFFEGLFANRPTECRRLHNITNSLILFDEAQTMPHGLAVYTLAALAELKQRYGCSVAFSTATQPPFGLFDSEIASLATTGWNPVEIVPPMLNLFERSRKVDVTWKEQLSFDEVASHIAREPQVLIILNTRKQTRRLYSLLVEQMGKEGIHYLSTDMCPSHRLDVIKEVKQGLSTESDNSAKPCYLVSTQCIEAGVDIDFPSVWRALAPLEAISQAAGRCNREGRRSSGRVVVFRLNTEDEVYPDAWYKGAATQLKVMLAQRNNEMDIISPLVIEEYYRQYWELRKTEFIESQLGDAIGGLDFQAAAKLYQWIPSNSINILVPYKSSFNEYIDLKELALNRRFNREWIQRARALSVSPRVNKNSELFNHVEQITNARGEATGWYLLINESIYREDIGLNYEDVSGALFG